MEQLRKDFIEYQKQFYNENNMYDLIDQSDQENAIIAGKYDDHILNHFKKTVEIDGSYDHIIRPLQPIKK